MPLPKERYLGRNACPHCSSPAKIRTIRPVSPTFSELHLECQGDPEVCGWRGVASTVIERTITQSANPNPKVSLPIAPPRRKVTGTPVPANDDAAPGPVPSVANDVAEERQAL